MTETRIRKRVEPFLRIGAVLCSLPNKVVVDVYYYYNPNPRDAWCSTTGIPWRCRLQENPFDDCFLSILQRYPLLRTISFSVDSCLILRAFSAQ